MHPKNILVLVKPRPNGMISLRLLLLPVPLLVLLLSHGSFCYGWFTTTSSATTTRCGRARYDVSSWCSDRSTVSLQQQPSLSQHRLSTWARAKTVVYTPIKTGYQMYSHQQQQQERQQRSYFTRRNIQHSLPRPSDRQITNSYTHFMMTTSMEKEEQTSIWILSASSSTSSNDATTNMGGDNNIPNVEQSTQVLPTTHTNGDVITDSESSSNGVTTNLDVLPKYRRKFKQLRQAIASIYSKYSQNGNQANSGSIEDDRLTFRQKLTKLGLATILSYGFVSNMSYAITVSCAWYIHNIQTQCSPLQQGQWKQFLVVYSGFWIFNNIVRPIRLGISVAVVAPQFDRILRYLQTQYHVSRPVAIGITVFMANVVCTITAMSLGIFIASLLSGVPIFP
jgi:hypothetical protein